MAKAGYLCTRSPRAPTNPTLLLQHDDVLQLPLSTWRSRAVGYAVSAYLVRGVLVDTGFHGVRDLVARLVDERRPRGAFVTHWHEDHAGNVDLLARRGVPLAMSAATEAIVRATPRIPFYRRFTWEQMRALASDVRPFAPDDLALVATPGHSPDHHIVWDPATRTIFSGDLYLGVKVRVTHRAEDPYTIVESLRAARALAPVRLFCAHRGLVTDPMAQLGAKIDWMEATIGEIERRLAEGRDDASVAREVLGPEDVTGWVSRGEYSRRNLVAAVRRRARARDEGVGN